MTAFSMLKFERRYIDSDMYYKLVGILSPHREDIIEDPGYNMNIQYVLDNIFII